LLLNTGPATGNPRHPCNYRKPYMDTLYLGIDFGTSGCRASVINDQRDVVAEHVIPTPVTKTGKPGVYEQNPHSWWNALQALLHKGIPENNLKSIRSICIDGTSSTLLLADGTGSPLSPALMYNDSRSHEQSEMIDQHAPRDCAAQGASSSLAKLLYLISHYPAARHAVHQSDWLTAMLTGKVGHSDENNCLKLGYDPVNQCWPEWIKSLGFNMDILPVVHEPGKKLASIDKTVARQFGLSSDTCIIAGTTDSTAAFLACGAENPGDAMTCLGSTLVTKIISSSPVFCSQHGVYSHRILGRWLAGGASNSGGSALLKYFSVAEMEQLSELLRPEQTTGLDFYPLPDAGERFPIADAEFQPRLPDKLPDTPAQRAVIFQGMLEGIAHIEKQGYDLLHKLGCPYPNKVLTTGGGSKNKAWERIRQNTLGVPTIQADHHQASYGAALLARHGFNH